VSFQSAVVMWSLLSESGVSLLGCCHLGADFRDFPLFDAIWGHLAVCYFHFVLLSVVIVICSLSSGILISVVIVGVMYSISVVILLLFLRFLKS
jgi:hypothetical protein